MAANPSGNRSRAVLFLVATIVLALLATTMVFNFLRKQQESAAVQAVPKDTVDVVVAARDLYMGLPILEDDIKVVKIPADLLPAEGVFATREDVVGRTPTERILAEEAIREQRLAVPDAGIGLNAIVRTGRRAMTVATDTETAVAGLLQPGNYVDVIVTIKPEDPTMVGAKWVAETILQGVKVLAVGSQLGGPTTDEKRAQGSSSQTQRFKPSITLEVMPQEAEKLALAISQGEIHVVLRADIDILAYDSDGITTNATILGIKERPEDPSVRVAPRRTEPAGPANRGSAEVISGSQKGVITFENDGTTTEKKNSRNR